MFDFPEYLCEVSARMSIELQAIFLVCNFLSDEIDTLIYSLQNQSKWITIPDSEYPESEIDWF